MNQGNRPNAVLGTMRGVVHTHLQGLVSREPMLLRLKWQMAASDGDLVAAFLNEIQEDPTLEADLVEDITSTFTDNVQHWKFPEEHKLSSPLTDALECTFPELVNSVYRAAVGLRRVRAMLIGVNVRLNLRGAHRSMGEALNLVIGELELLSLAGEHVATDAPLRSSFPEEEDDGRGPWSSPAGEPLSPKQIVWLADLCRKHPDSSIGYADGISAHSTPPQLVTERIKARKDRLIRTQQYREIEEQMRKAMAQSCPRCNSAPGEFCRSRAGKETTMHKGRYTMAAG
ncbi:hypothetical protein AB4Y80_04085 [Specibacter sp. RAF43]